MKVCSFHNSDATRRYAAVAHNTEMSWARGLAEIQKSEIRVRSWGQASLVHSTSPPKRMWELLAHPALRSEHSWGGVKKCKTSRWSKYYIIKVWGHFICLEIFLRSFQILYNTDQQPTRKQNTNRNNSYTFTLNYSNTIIKTSVTQTENSQLIMRRVKTPL